MDSARSRYLQAERLWSDGDYAASVNEFEKVIQKDPKGTLGLQALFRSAMTQTLFLSQPVEAMKKLKSYVDLSADAASVWEAQKQIGEILFSKLEQYDQAITHYGNLIPANSSAPEVPEFFFRVAKSHFFLWHFDEAISTYQEVFRRFPESPWAEKALYEVGVTEFTRGNRGAQVDVPVQGERRSSRNSSGSNAYQRAIQSFGEFVRRFPKSNLVPQARFGIASCLEELDQLDDAYSQYEALQKTYPSPQVVAIKMSRIRERKHQRNR